MNQAVNRYTFNKKEKLCSKIQIEKLFSEGKSLVTNRFRLLYLETTSVIQPQVRVLIAVPKRNIKHAVNRNRMKRLIREAYRLNKHKLTEMYAAAGKDCNIAFLFTGKACISQQETAAAIFDLLNRLIDANEKNPE